MIVLADDARGQSSVRYLFFDCLADIKRFNLVRKTSDRLIAASSEGSLDIVLLLIGILIKHR